ncbi:MAG: 3-deoxy-D-manno-octulosonic acid transferase [Candidatus Pelagibacterales bacterium]|nr:MAG: 3-deoxy-D-manno-octulosonic acid transferase [Pelagibacterales bacterium]
MYFWYKFFTYLFYPFASFYLNFRKLKKKEDNIRYKEKLSNISVPRDNGFLIWFHIASVGEAMSILSIIDRCVEEKKIDKILLTSITLSSGKILEKKFRQNTKVIHQFLPLDIPNLTKRFLDHWKPNLSIFVESEIWPNLILQISKKKIPLLLINGRITKKTFNRWRLIKNFAKKVFEKFDLCLASTKESENFLKILGAKNIKNHGNLKFAQSKKNLKNELDNIFLNKVKNRKIWCGASTHPDEEILCAESHLKIKKSFNNILTVIIPRYIDRASKIKENLLNLDLKVALYSKLEEFDEKTDILIIDSYGESLKFYNISKSVFVGKSLSKNLILNSGQNPIEAARMGCKIFHGPNVSNFVEIYEYLKILDVTKKVNNSDELGLSVVEEFKNKKTKNDEILSKIENYGQNIFDNVIMELKKYI